MNIKLLSPVKYKDQEITELELIEDVTGHAEKVLLSQEMGRNRIMNKFLAMQIKETNATLVSLSDTDKYKIVKLMLDVDIKRCVYEIYRAFKDCELHLDITYTTGTGQQKTFSGEVPLPEVSANEFNVNERRFTLDTPISIYGEIFSDFIVKPITGGLMEQIEKENNPSERISLLIEGSIKTSDGKTIPSDISENLSMKVRNVLRTKLNELPDFNPSVTIEDGTDSFEYPVNILDFF